MEQDSDYSQAADDIAGISRGTLSFTVSLSEDGERLDRVLAAHLPRLSRSRLQEWIAQGAVLVDSAVPKKARTALVCGQRVEVTEQPLPEDLAFTPADIPVDAVYEDGAILIVRKPAGLVVHPAAGHWNDTLLNGLLARDRLFARLPRAGIVHRLDRDTSGLMVVAKTLEAQTNLVAQLQARTVKREYWALVRGSIPDAFEIEKPLARDPANPLRFSVSKSPSARYARTSVRCIARAVSGGASVSWAACRLATGRTHQIRVHMESEGFPLVGDPVYRGRLARLPEGTPLGDFPRQALHASRLGLLHPVTGAHMEWFAPPPEDLQGLLYFLGMGPLDRPSTVFEECP